MADRVAEKGRGAERIGYLIGLHDFSGNGARKGGNILVDGNPAGTTTVYGEYPHAGSKAIGSNWVSDLGSEAPKVPLLKRGDHRSPGDTVEPAPPAFISKTHPASRPERSGTGTGARLSLARWLTEPRSLQSALLARVTMNRLWQQYFGVGIVATPDNLGLSGSRPTHPELLEWMASEFIASGWSMRAMHRLLLRSADKQSGQVLGAPYQFHAHGQCGMELSELLPHTGSIADDITLIRSMTTGSVDHESALRIMHTGRFLAGLPGLGSWALYGLGTENENLPAYVVLSDPGGLPVDGERNWSSGFLPALYQGTPFRSGQSPVFNLKTPERVTAMAREGQLKFLKQLNGQHASRYPENTELRDGVKITS